MLNITGIIKNTLNFNGNLLYAYCNFCLYSSLVGCVLGVGLSIKDLFECPINKYENYLSKKIFEIVYYIKHILKKGIIGFVAGLVISVTAIITVPVFTVIFIQSC
jgi:hypothetical protein